MIGSDVVIRGELAGNANVEFAGTLEGTLVIDGFVAVRSEGRITGRVQAAAVLIEGSVNGEIHAAGKVELRRSCRVEADIFAGSVAIADGSAFEGAITMNDHAAAPQDLAFTEKREDKR